MLRHGMSLARCSAALLLSCILAHQEGAWGIQGQTPTVSGINPASGSTNGGTAVTITGTNFAAGATVTLGGTAATGVTVVSDTQITATTPARPTAGAVDVVVTNSNGNAGTLAGGYTYTPAAAPSISSVNPTTGYTVGGTQVTVAGGNFAAGATVSFGGVAGTNAIFDSAAQLRVTTPAHAAGTVDVVVTNPDTQSVTLASSFTFTVPPAPTFGSLSPTSGTSLGGTTVIISGTNFLAGATVTFGGTAATSATVSSATSISAVTPAHAPEVVDVVVTNPDSQSVTATQAYTYDAAAVPTVSSITPDTGPSTGGTSVTIAGANFVGGATVIIGGTAASSVSVTSATAITAVTPQHSAGVVDVSVRNPDGQIGTLTGGFTYYTAGIGASGFRFVTTTLPSGEVDKAYSATVVVEGGSIPTSGLTYIRFGAADLPPGLSLNGLTGVISGEPELAGTFNVTFTATDLTDNAKAVALIPLIVFPKNSTFQFETTALTSGEMNSPYSFTVTVANAPGGGGGLKFTASGLPPGLSMDSNSGVISGSPTRAGTFLVWLTASKGGESITTNLPLFVMPPGSSFRWSKFFLPGAFLNQVYSPEAPPVTLNTLDPGPSGAYYTATGLPPGITYAATGEFSGTPVVTGIFPVTFTALESATGAQLIFNMEFVVFPPNGGDTNSLPINVWAKKAAFKRADPGKGSWQAQWIYNADRRTTPPMIYDLSTDPVVMALGTNPEVSIARDALVGDRPKYSYKTLTVAMKLDEGSQVLSLMNKGLTVEDRYSSTLRNTVRLGTRAYRLDMYFDDTGKFRPALGYRNTAFVVASAKATVKAATKDSLSFSMLLGNPTFAFPVNQNKTVRFRVFNSAGAVIVDKDFTPIIAYTTAVDTATGETVYKLKSGLDGTATPGKFSYDSKSGKMTASLKALTLAGTGLLTGVEEHVSVEISVAEKQYYTSVTLFAPKTGAYSTKLR